MASRPRAQLSSFVGTDGVVTSRFLPVRMGFGAALTAAIAICIGAGMVDASTVNPDYAGSVFGDKGSEVLIGIKRKDGVAVKGHAQVKHIELTCDDGSTVRRNLSAVPFRFRNESGVFDGREFRTSDFGQTYLQIHGRLTSNGRAAEGWVYWIDDVNDPAEAGHVDCSTSHPASWTAKPVR